ncbi:ABC transporter permease [Microvirga rosea]|uniref:ABC transporter permease n=1 Tax=Microvirga rosea TaxID=2715425 RepID=UPI001D09C2BD|nr:ABC transporter permease [Microvirga rosea]MCB8821932.1 ABC transporter permease [Microvirga rosea]
MIMFFLRRLLGMAIVLLAMSFVVYGLIGLMPGDPIDLMVMSNPGITAADADRLRALYSLDEPLVTRYGHWLIAALQGDFGFSRVYAQPVLDIIGPALWQTTKLVALTLVISSILATALGILSALRPGGKIDTLVSFISFAGISLPSFWLALILILTFAVWLGWLPASGMGRPGEEGFLGNARFLILPVTTLVIANIGGVTRYARSALIETLRMDFIRTARAKGAREPRVVLRHGVPNALSSVITVIGMNFGTLFSGALITETMFAQRGLGKTIYDAILGNDYNLALVALLFATFATLIGNLLADLACAWLDPRISVI